MPVFDCYRLLFDKLYRKWHYLMIKTSKVIVTIQEKLVMVTRTLGVPLYENEAG